MTEEPNIEQIHAAQNGDRNAMHALLQPWNDVIFSFMVHSLRNRADAEDAAQETFIRIVKALPRYEHRGQFRAWVFSIARNQAALTAGRRQRVADREISLEPEALHALSGPVENDALEQAERATEIRRAVASLPPGEREVIELRIDEDLKFHEIAARTGAPLNTVLGRMHHAVRRLRILLDPLKS